jgi:hypothetical protein
MLVACWSCIVDKLSISLSSCSASSCAARETGAMRRSTEPPARAGEGSSEGSRGLAIGRDWANGEDVAICPYRPVLSDSKAAAKSCPAVGGIVKGADISDYHEIKRISTVGSQ